MQNGLNPDDRIQNIWARIPFKGGKAVNIKNVILRSLIRQIAIFHSRKRHDPGNLLSLFLTHSTVFCNLTVHFLIDLTNKAFQAHNAAFSCFKRLAALAVHRTESDMQKFRFRLHQSGFPCTAENLFKIQVLTFIRYINHFIRLIFVHTIHDRCQISRII